MSNEPRTVLVADSDRENVEALVERCQAMGLRVQTAFDGVTALTNFTFAGPDILCIDANLEGGRGPVCDTIIDETLRTSVPVIAMHADSESPQPDQGERVFNVAKTEALCDQVESLLRKLV